MLVWKTGSLLDFASLLLRPQIPTIFSQQHTLFCKCAPLKKLHSHFTMVITSKTSEVNGCFFVTMFFWPYVGRSKMCLRNLINSLNKYYQTPEKVKYIYRLLNIILLHKPVIKYAAFWMYSTKLVNLVDKNY